MNALRFHGRHDLRLDEVEEPTCGYGQVKVRPLYVGICGTDLHEYSSGPVLIPEKPHPITGAKRPVTMGHEFSGEIEEVGPGVHDSRLRVGRRVAVRPTIYDEECSSCKQGVRHCCENIGFIGLSGYGGGMAQHIVGPSRHFYPIEDSIPTETAALIEPLAVAWHAVTISPFKPGHTALVIGGGPIGICVVQILKLKGAGDIVVVEPMDSRKKFAREYGATVIIDPGETDVVTRTREFTHENGADVVFDTAGVEAALNGVIPACRTHGAIVNIALWERGPTVRVNDLMYREVQYMQAALYDEVSFKETVRALSDGLLDPTGMITATVKLEDVVEKGFKALLEERDRHCKILVDMQG
ncbi:GroES-like protein [Aspergillus taichungensis]|uniref:GroES-like protein n=1 Tax=Aspergillus taichungensis TaxID=482145 RepID=A0A2J5I8C9_9EURO|nr:GroES-like protein [Aspergillus taichungensis]